MRSPKKFVSEMWANFDVSRSSWFGPNWNALRGMFMESFFKKPLMEGSIVQYDLARALYRNAAPDYKFGAGFVRPIIDLSVEYMGLPSVSGTGDDAFLNECITDYWADDLQQMFRDTMRDSKVIVRYRQPSLTNPLFTEQDRVHGRIEVFPPEEVEVIFSPTDPDLVDRAVFTHFIDIDERTDDEILAGVAPRMSTHEIVEIVTPANYTFFDKTSGEPLPSWGMRNPWRFAPVWPAFNEYAADLGGGQSDIEPILTFIQAFHDVLTDVLAAHNYHSIPKAKFNLKNVDAFIKNNWPDVIDPATGKIKDGAKVNWQGKEIMFFAEGEDGGFIEAQSVLGDSKTLLEFLIDCICIAGETPRWALLAQNGALPETDASVAPFAKKIDRKRISFREPLVMICKMALVANGKTPITPRLGWGAVKLHDLVEKAQAIQQLILGFDAAAAHEWIADRTVVQILGTLFDEVSDPDKEMADAKNNVVPAIPPPAPASPTQGAQTTSTKSNGNGGGSSSTAKKAVKKALSTTKASNS